MSNDLEDLSLIEDIKNNNNSASVEILSKKHSGIYNQVINNHFSGEENSENYRIFKEDELYNAYLAAKSFNPEKNSKFSTYFYNATRWKCLTFLGKQKKAAEFPMEKASIIAAEKMKESLNPRKSLITQEVIQEFNHILNSFSDKRVKKIFDMRYFIANNKPTSWEIIGREVGLTRQGCLNIHNNYLKKIKERLKNAQ